MTTVAGERGCFSGYRDRESKNVIDQAYATFSKRNMGAAFLSMPRVVSATAAQVLRSQAQSTAASGRISRNLPIRASAPRMLIGASIVPPVGAGCVIDWSS